jgi:signal transduction histidine kinase
VNLPKLYRTTAVRLALRYALVYALMLGLALAAFYWYSSRYVDAQLEAGLAQELRALTELFETAGMDGLAEAIRQRVQDDLHEGRFYLLVSPAGETLAGNLFTWPAGESVSLDAKVHRTWIEDDTMVDHVYDDDAYVPVIAEAFSDGTRLLLAAGVEQAEALHEITEFLIEVLGASVVLALIMSVILGRTILARMDTISRTAGDIMAGDLSQRVPVSGHDDEFDALAKRLNTMLDRIQQLIKGIREVTDNVAHDLRSPLSRLCNRLEVTLLEPRSEPEYREAISGGIEDAKALIKTFNAMLGIAQAEAGNHRTQWGRVDLNRLAVDLTDLYQPAARHKGQKLELTTRGSAEITGSRELLAQALGNLLDNAIKYTPTGGRIRLQVEPSDAVAEVRVSDSGPGIPAAEREHVLARFVRLDSSRHTPGNGLGLSLVQAVARLHKAELVLGDAGPGLLVSLRFPRHAVE